jgi:hypothetical protein
VITGAPAVKRQPRKWCLEIGYAAGGYDVQKRDVGLVQFTLRSSSATMIDTTKSNTTKR